jgi:hypothetical protein
MHNALNRGWREMVITYSEEVQKNQEKGRKDMYQGIGLQAEIITQDCEK